MKLLTQNKNCCDEAMKRLTLLKNRSNEAFNTSSPRFIASSLSTLYKFMQKSPLINPGLLDQYVKAKTTKFIGFAMKIMAIYELLLKLPMQIIASSLLCVNIFCS
jgi:hypothetical protein